MPMRDRRARAREVGRIGPSRVATPAAARGDTLGSVLPLPNVYWTEIDGQQCLAIRFVGNLSADAARSALDEVRAALRDRGDKINMVWDAAEMTGYETEARTLWQQGMAELKSRIHAIHLVADSAIIRMGAAVVGMFIGYPIHSWATLDAVRLER
jgi:hypothetical protein